MKENEVIYYEGDHVNEVFFIKKGKACLVIPQYNNFPFITITTGYYVGEIEFFFKEHKRKHTLMTLSQCEFLVMTKKDF